MSLIKHTLLIDDNPLDRFIHKKLLTHYDISAEVKECSSGREALNFFKDEEVQCPDLILLDLMMPEMNGFEFLKHYAKFYSNLQLKPLLFMVSSTEDENDMQKARENQFISKLLHKPLLPETLIKLINIHSSGEI
jgi:CheY-like chemotaxis protein